MAVSNDMMLWVFGSVFPLSFFLSGFHAEKVVRYYDHEVVGLEGRYHGMGMTLVRLAVNFV